MLLFSLSILYIFLASIGLSVQDDVLELGDENFEDGVKGKEIMLVEFFAPWCGHCKRLAPEYEDAATRLSKVDPPISLAKVDCTEAGKEICSKHGVSGYPTLKIFKDGKMHSDYDGPRNADGIVNYMKKNSGPASRDHESLEKLKKRIDNADDVIIVGFFTTKDDDFHKRFMKAADNKRQDFDFAHTFSADALEHYKQTDSIVLFRPPKMNVKFEENHVALALEPDTTVYTMEKFFDENQFGRVGQLRPSNEKKFDKPLVVAYYEVDWKRNKKGTNYYRNRVARVAKNFLEKVNFAIANKGEFQRNLDDWKFDSSEDVHVAAKNKNGDVFLLKDTTFNVANLEAFVWEFIDGKLSPYVKSEPVPETNDAPVKVVVGETFKDIVNDPTKDVLIEFYAPWCGHCKSLEPKFTALAEKLAGVKDVVIAKMDSTANDAPKNFAVSGFPTIYWAPMGNKENPKKYSGGREIEDFVKFIQAEATNPIEIPAKKGKTKKTKKSKEEL